MLTCRGRCHRCRQEWGRYTHPTHSQPVVVCVWARVCVRVYWGACEFSCCRHAVYRAGIRIELRVGRVDSGVHHVHAHPGPRVRWGVGGAIEGQSILGRGGYAHKDQDSERGRTD